jgi:SAM-dependent methyltransferase
MVMEQIASLPNEDPCGLSIDTASFFGLDSVSCIRRRARLGLTDRSYLPKALDPRSDWVASVAVPAFLALAQTGVEARDFCTIGTGSGLDALAAIEILKAHNVVVLDLHEDVARQARRNIQDNIVMHSQVTLFSTAGDLLTPIADKNHAFDLIYENLPNIPLDTGDDLGVGQTSSTFIAERREVIPGFVSQYLVALHYLALQQAAQMLKPGGRVLSSIGGRIPIPIILRLARETGYAGDILIYTWKVQSEPEEVIGGYAAWEQRGLGPFHFYPVTVLEDTFRTLSPVAAGAQAEQIELALRPHVLSATAALEALHGGAAVGHTVVVLESLKS